jgi:hypothetical protein
MGFYEVFLKFGIKKDVVYPTYGLAEHTVFVCSGGLQVVVVKKTSLEKGRVEIIQEEKINYKEMEDNFLPEDTQRIVGCGYPGNHNDVEVAVVDPETRERTEPLVVGEIWVNSPSKAEGYWNQPEQSLHDFEAVINEKMSENSTRVSGKRKTYLRTGDLGFMHHGELFICGRLKDLIIVGGTNHYPQDIERTIERGLADQLRPGCSACFSLNPTDKKSEEIIYIAEVKDGVSPSQYDYIVQICRELASIEHGVGLKTICLLELRTIPKTTSGKIARAWCRKAYLEKKLSILYRSDAETNEFPEVSQGSVTEGGGGGGEKTGGPGSVGGNGYAKLGQTDIPTNSNPKEPTSNHATGTGGGSSQRVVRSGNYTPNMVIPTSENGHDNTPPLNPSPSKLTVGEIRALPHDQIVRKLEASLIQVSSVGPSTLIAPLDENVPLTSYGLDSMTIVQFKGVLEHR